MTKKMLDIIDVVIRLCQEEQQKGYPGEATKKQVEECILPEMYELKESLITCKKLERDFIISFANAFKAWDWNMTNATELYRMLSELHRIYHNYYKSSEASKL